MTHCHIYIIEQSGCAFYTKKNKMVNLGFSLLLEPPSTFIQKDLVDLKGTNFL